MITTYPDSKVHGVNMGPICGRQDPSGPMLAPWTLLSGYMQRINELHMHDSPSSLQSKYKFDIMWRKT